MTRSTDRTRRPLTPEHRRARRTERREKRLQVNVRRAAKMHAARIVYQKEEASSKSNVNSMPANFVAPRLNIGCSGWFYWDWKDRFYAPGITTREWFQHYADRFDTVELNAPFYSWPTIATVQSWVRQAQKRPFASTVKVRELITHVKQLTRTVEPIKDVYFIEPLLKEHMGCFLFQLPPSFHYAAPRLKRILDQLDSSKRNVVEFRHRRWWNKQTYAAFKKTKSF